MTKIRDGLFSLVLVLAGCATGPSTVPGPIRYRPTEGEHLTTSVKALTDVDIKPRLTVVPGAEFEYDPKFAGSPVLVVVEVLLDASGRVAGTRVISSEPEFVGVPVAKSFLRAGFLPAKKDGKPVPCRIQVTEDFRLPR